MANWMASARLRKRGERGGYWNADVALDVQQGPPTVIEVIRALAAKGFVTDYVSNIRKEA